MLDEAADLSIASTILGLCTIQLLGIDLGLMHVLYVNVVLLQHWNMQTVDCFSCVGTRIYHPEPSVYIVLFSRSIDSAHRYIVGSYAYIAHEHIIINITQHLNRSYIICFTILAGLPNTNAEFNIESRDRCRSK